MSFFALSALINGLTSLVLAILVFLKNRKLTVNKTFILFCLSAAAWSLPYFFWQISEDEASALFWSRALIGGAIFIPIFYLHFVLAFLEKIKENKRLLIIIYIFAFLSLASDFTPLFVKSVEPALSFAFWPKPGMVFHTFLVTWFLIIIYTTYLLLKKYRTATGILRDQIRYILIGMTIGYIGGSTNYFLWYGIPIKPYGNILASVYVGTTAYAIIVHRLMDIKVVLRRSTVYLSSILVIVIPTAAVLYLTSHLYPESSIAASLAALILGVSLFPPLRTYFYRLANKYFFSSLYDSREVIAGISDRLRSTLDIHEVYNVIGQTITNAFHSQSFGVLGYAPKSDEYFVLFNQGFDIGRETRFSGNRELQEKFVNQSKSLVVEELKAVFDHRYKDTLDLLIKFKVAVLTPLNIKDETLGLLVLGPKETGDMYNDEDLSTLEVIGSQAAIAIKNAQLYEETRKFSQTLQQEVDHQTAELKKANVELRKLDRAKSDFISIASHQLRTPLSAIKGAISMILEGGSFGSVRGKTREKLGAVYEYNERLIKLVNDLLDLTHMEGGKMEFNFAKINFSEMAFSVVEELKLQAEKKKLKFEFARPKENYFVWADEQKLRQVVMNLIDNAIKYTEKGGVKVWLGRTDGLVEFSVKDTGLGMNQGEIANLFQKFVRGPNAPRLHAEGAGVGLYVAKLLIEAHKGQVWAESEGEGKGSTFFVKIPEYVK